LDSLRKSTLGSRVFPDKSGGQKGTDIVEAKKSPFSARTAAQMSQKLVHLD
jgi:hypothetical protein